jgi:hypothetical protein
MYSIDLNKKFYRNPKEDVGFFIPKAIEKLGVSKSNHSLYTGDYAVNFASQIGTDIDLLILDTAHVLPGELLDFIAFLPLLKLGATVIIHDVNLHQMSENHSDSMSNCLLLSSAVGIKLINILDDSKEFKELSDTKKALIENPELKFSNIAAIEVTSQTIEHIENVFQALMLSWKYLPNEHEFSSYRNHFKSYYSKDLVKLFEIAYVTNTYLLSRKTMNYLRYKPLSIVGIYLIPVRFVSNIIKFFYLIKHFGIRLTFRKISKKFKK